jgi:hypothetical protein
VSDDEVLRTGIKLDGKNKSAEECREDHILCSKGFRRSGVTTVVFLMV